MKRRHNRVLKSPRIKTNVSFTLVQKRHLFFFFLLFFFYTNKPVILRGAVNISVSRFSSSKTIDLKYQEVEQEADSDPA